MTMSDWKRALNRFLEFNQLEVLIDKGTISHQQAEEKAVAVLGEGQEFVPRPDFQGTNGGTKLRKTSANARKMQ